MFSITKSLQEGVSVCVYVPEIEVVLSCPSTLAPLPVSEERTGLSPSSADLPTPSAKQKHTLIILCQNLASYVTSGLHFTSTCEGVLNIQVIKCV